MTNTLVLVSIVVLLAVIFVWGFRVQPKPATLDERLKQYLLEVAHHQRRGTLTIKKRRELLHKYLPRQKLPRGKLPKR